MSLVTFLICVCIPLVRAEFNIPAIVDPKYGNDTYCQFAYYGSADPNNMKTYTTPSAQVFGEGRLPGYKVGFSKIYSGEICETLVEDPNEVVCGTAYLVPRAEFNRIKQKFLYLNNERFRNFITVTVNVTIKDTKQPIQLSCNAIKNMIPSHGKEIVCKRVMDIGVDAYKAVNFPQQCLDQFTGYEVNPHC